MLFLLACIPVRVGIAVFAYKRRRDTVASPLLFLFTFLVGISFLVLWVCPSIRPTARESSAPGHVVWWGSQRIFHAAFYLTFAVMYSNPKWREHAWALLCLDVLFGLTLSFQARAHRRTVF
jgi:hypothetical protein